MSDGWIKVYNKMTEWEWYGDPNMVATWLHLLLTANWKDKEWRGMTIKRGQLITSVAKLSEAIGQTERQTRVCLDRLIESKQIVKQTTNKFTIITICKYDSYQYSEETERQPNDKQNVTLTSNERQTNDKQGVTPMSTTKDYIEDKKEKPLRSKDHLTCVSDAHARIGVEYYGTFHNVELLPQERRTLVEQYGEALVDETIDSLSCKLMDGNAQSNYHYATLQTWLRHSYKSEVPQHSTAETEEQKCRRIWAMMKKEDQEQHLKDNDGLYPWEDPRYNKSLIQQDYGNAK